MKIKELSSFLEQAKSTLDDIRVKGGRAKNQVDILEKSLDDFKGGLSSLQRDNATLTIGIVGQMNVGKSSFLNALLFEGKDVLPMAATPMTAGLTILEYADSIDSQRFEVEYYNKNDWDDIKARNEIVSEIRNGIIKEHPELAGSTQSALREQQVRSKCERENYACYLLISYATPEACMKIDGPNDVIPLKQTVSMSDVLTEYVGANGKFTSTVKALHIYLHDDSLTFQNKNTGIMESYRIVDTPGVNDPIVSRQRLTEKFLQEAHAVFMLTRADTFLPEADIMFMNANISKEGVSNTLLVANKLDLLFAVDGNCPNDLDDAIEYEIKQVEQQFNVRGVNLNRRPIAICCTAGIAENLRLKLSSNYDDPKLNGDEEHTLMMLCNKFPNDFCDKESTLDSLDKIADFPTIIEEYIQGTFLENKDRIINEKISDFIKCHRDAIMDVFKTIIDEVDKELEFARDYDISTIESQISALEEMQIKLIRPLQIRIIKFSASLKEKHAKEMFEVDLPPYKPRLKHGYTDTKSISYTRKGTVFGGTKSGYVYVDVLNPSSVIDSEEKQIDELRNQTNKRWKTIYDKEEEALKKALFDAIKEIVNEDSSLDINVKLFENIILGCINNSLIGKSQLGLEVICSKHKKRIADYVNVSEHTDFNRAFGKMSEDDANEKISKQARERLTTFEANMWLKNDLVYNDLRTEVNKHSELINDIMTRFANNLTGTIADELNRIRKEKVENRNNREQVCKEIEDRKNKYVELQNKFKQL